MINNFISIIILGTANSIAVNDTLLRFHPVESYCIDYSEVGPFGGVGWRKICSRNFGAETYSISYSENEGGNVRTGERWKTACHQHSIETDGKVYTFDLNGDYGIVHADPKLELKKTSARAYSTRKTLDAYVAPYGYEPTGDNDIVAGLPCSEYLNAAANSRACYSEDLLLLRLTQSGFISYELVATAVSVGDAGTDENYRLYENRSFVELKPNEMFIFQCSRVDEDEEWKSPSALLLE